MKVTIHRDALKAVSYLSANKDWRDYLNGVYVEYSPTETRLIACNGHALGIHRSAVENEGSGSFLIPVEAVKTMLGWKVSNHVASTPITSTCTDGRYHAELIVHGCSFQPIDTQFPDYRRIIPDKCSGEVAQFNPDYIAAFAKAACALGSESGYATIAHNGNGAALVNIGQPDFIGVLMPLRHNSYSVIDTAPEWVKGAV